MILKRYSIGYHIIIIIKLITYVNDCELFLAGRGFARRDTEIPRHCYLSTWTRCFSSQRVMLRVNHDTFEGLFLSNRALTCVPLDALFIWQGPLLLSMSFWIVCHLTTWLPRYVLLVITSYCFVLTTVECHLLVVLIMQYKHTKPTYMKYYFPGKCLEQQTSLVSFCFAK